jgi:hypothetical protein
VSEEILNVTKLVDIVRRLLEVLAEAVVVILEDLATNLKVLLVL